MRIADRHNDRSVHDRVRHAISLGTALWAPALALAELETMRARAARLRRELDRCEVHIGIVLSAIDAVKNAGPGATLVETIDGHIVLQAAA